MWTGFSNAATAAIAGNCVVAIQVQVFDSDGVLLQDITDAVTGGSVVEDETAAVRRVLTLTLNDPTLMPAQPTDLLHPLSGNEIYVWRGVKVNGATELAPLGVFRLSKPQASDTGASWTFTITANDRSSEISLHPWTNPYTTAAGQTIHTAIKGIINSRWPGPALTFNLFPSTITVPPGFTLGIQYTSDGTQSESGSTSGNNDPWADCRALALTAGCELFFDRLGIVVMRPIPQPGTQADAASFVEGPGCTVLSGTRTLDESTFANQIILVGTGVVVTNSDGSKSPGAPVVATASSSDPNYGIGGPLGTRPRFVIDETISTTGDAQVAANAQLAIAMKLADATAVTAVDNPALDAGDQVELVRARLQVDADYIVQSVTHPLDASTAMSVTNRSFAVNI